MVLNVILAILVLSIIVIVHEFGHFIIAKANGITVVEFSIGFGPKLIHFRKGETEYCIKALPFGGACTMLGDEFLEMSVIQSEEDDDEELTDEEKEAKKRKLAIENGYDMEKSFASKSVWAVSQATDMRRVNIEGALYLHDDYGWCSGGFLADSNITRLVDSGSQQQWLSRNDNWGTWMGENWNMVFVGEEKGYAYDS